MLSLLPGVAEIQFIFFSLIFLINECIFPRSSLCYLSEILIHEIFLSLERSIFCCVPSISSCFRFYHLSISATFFLKQVLKPILNVRFCCLISPGPLIVLWTCRRLQICHILLSCMSAMSAHSHYCEPLICRQMLQQSMS